MRNIAWTTIVVHVIRDIVPSHPDDVALANVNWSDEKEQAFPVPPPQPPPLPSSVAVAMCESIKDKIGRVG
ncbi:hypothetical protein M0804_002593 [Polistes exclamans]|nr:hypothetical protein M0804_002593 [Polistes exclamans]